MRPRHSLSSSIRSHLNGHVHIYIIYERSNGATEGEREPLDSQDLLHNNAKHMGVRGKGPWRTGSRISHSLAGAGNNSRDKKSEVGTLSENSRAGFSIYIYVLAPLALRKYSRRSTRHADSRARSASSLMCSLSCLSRCNSF